jgi:hypothetical protein
MQRSSYFVLAGSLANCDWALACGGRAAAGKPSQHRRPDTIAGMSPNGTAQAGLVEVVNVAGGVDSRNPVEQQYLLTPVR